MDVAQRRAAPQKDGSPCFAFIGGILGEAVAEERVRPELRLSVIVFLTLQHRVVVGGKLGALHNHSCSVEVEVTPPTGDTIPFAEMEAEIKSQITPLDGRTLNDLANFQGINPTIENLAAHLFSRLEFISAEYGGVLNSVTVRESPTRSVKVVRPSSAFTEYKSEEGGAVTTGSGTVYREPPSDDVRIPDKVDEPKENLQMRQVEDPRTARFLVGEIPFSPNQVDSSEFDDHSRAIQAEAQITQEDHAVAEKLEEAPDLALGRTVAEGDVAAGSEKLRDEPALAPAAQPLPQTPARSGMGFADKRPLLAILITVGVYAATAAFIYRKVLWPPAGQGFPWGSDTWGHIRKAQFLLQEMMNGNYFPKFSPMWYNGVEPFRYWAPLPYYMLAGLMRALGDPFLAAGWYVAVCALIGASGWLSMRNRFGFAQAGFAGFIWLFWQDNVRVAMSEGNLPRVLATALFPYLLHCFLMVVDRSSEKSVLKFAALACVSGVAIIAHAMIAATYFIGLTIVGFFWILCTGIRSKDLARGVLGISAGIGLSAWWLIPSLQNGIVSIDKEAISEAMQFFPLKISMNPYLRLSQPEIFYWGISLAAVVLSVLATWRKRTKLSYASMFVGIIIVAASTPAFRPLYRSIPFHHLIFPLYLATVAAGVFLIAGFNWDAAKEQTKRDKWIRVGVSVALLVILAADSYASTTMIATRIEPSYLTDLAEHMPRGGWREATLDMSRFGSAATYILSQDCNRELVYGWAWQGATTGSNIVNLNTALQTEHYQFLLDRLIELGATHIVARREILRESEFLAEAAKRGFKETWRSSEGIVFVADGGPYALRTEYMGIVIGKFASNWAQMFPTLATGVSPAIDQYEYKDLSPYKVIVISGGTWEDRSKAEDLLSRLAAAGHRVIVDMEGLPEDVLSKRPLFMGVTGEPIMLYRAPTVYAPGAEFPDGFVQAFDEKYYPWKAHTPQGVEKVALEFPYLGETVTVLGSKTIGAGSVWFIGANLPYHAYLTGDPYSLKLLSSTMGLEPDMAPNRTKIPLSDYSAGAQGYKFTIQVPGPGPVSLTIPIAARSNMVVSVDGVRVRFGSVHNMITVDFDAGTHAVSIEPQYPFALRPAVWVSVGCALCLVLLGIGQAIGGLKVPVKGRVLAE